MSEWVSLCVSVCESECVCVCERVWEWVCVSECVWVRVGVCVCVCVRECEWVCVSESACVSVYLDDTAVGSDVHMAVWIRAHTPGHRNVGGARGLAQAPPPSRSNSGIWWESGEDCTHTCTWDWCRQRAVTRRSSAGDAVIGQILTTATGDLFAKILVGHRGHQEDGVFGPFLNAVDVEDTVTGHTTPHLRHGEGRQAERVSVCVWEN